MLRGLDLSSYQGSVDFESLKSNIDFVIIKASEGTGFIDPQLQRNQSEARRLGIPLGYYHFARPDLGNSPEAEAEWFKAAVNVAEGELLCLDFEVNYTDGVNWCRGFLDHLSYLLGGYKPLIYLNLSLVGGSDWSSVINENYGLWLADYDGSTDPIGVPWPVLALKQFSSTGSVPGVSGNVDLDVFYGDLGTFSAYGYSPSAPAPEPCSFTDQTKIPIGVDSHGYSWGEMELQAVRSSLGDMKAQIDQLNPQIDSLNSANKQQADMLAAYQTQIGSLNDQIRNLQTQLNSQPQWQQTDTTVTPTSFWQPLLDFLKKIFGPGA